MKNLHKTQFYDESERICILGRYRILSYKREVIHFQDYD